MWARPQHRKSCRTPITYSNAGTAWIISWSPVRPKAQKPYFSVRIRSYASLFTSRGPTEFHPPSLWPTFPLAGKCTRLQRRRPSGQWPEHRIHRRSMHLRRPRAAKAALCTMLARRPWRLGAQARLSRRRHQVLQRCGHIRAHHSPSPRLP